jgi:hypothetical protein
MTIKFDPVYYLGPLHNGEVLSNHSPLTVSDIAKRITVMRFESNLLPTNAEIIGESAQLFVNGREVGVFKISPQNPKRETFGSGGYVIWATNSTPAQ